ncbi:hypothetical protein C1645_832261 [Glomus cerebriforme]|uniref:Uncharacterized protein n=1 Tax=Glomus cerebriforme TaxID=658196 RepID=A0A397SNM2_9GLOM|nr:hypothetical protein C1645_832261 [Glomus cerebriforme]
MDYFKRLEKILDNQKTPGNGEKPFSSAILGKKFSQIGIDRTRLQNNGKREYHYILDRSKIVARLRELGLENNLPQSEKNTPSPNTSKDKKASNQDDSTQAFFDYVAKDIRAPVASTSGTSETSKLLEPVINKPEVSKPFESIKPSNPDVFVTITEKDIRLSHEYRDRMMSDADAVDFAKEDGMDVNDIFYMSRRERLISEEIYLRNHEDAGKPRVYVYDNEEWRKGINIFQENGHLW